MNVINMILNHDMQFRIIECSDGSFLFRKKSREDEQWIELKEFTEIEKRMKEIEKPWEEFRTTLLQGIVSQDILQKREKDLEKKEKELEQKEARLSQSRDLKTELAD